MGAQKFMRAQKLLRGHDASASQRHPQMAPDTDTQITLHLQQQAAYMHWIEVSPTALLFLLNLDLIHIQSQANYIWSKAIHAIIRVRGQGIQQLEWKQTDGRTRPIALPSPSSLTRSVLVSASLKAASYSQQ